VPAKKKVPSKRELLAGCESLVRRVLFYLLVAVILVFNLLPFFWALVGSFRPSKALFSTNLSPKALNFDH
jgi:ABC-type glycerol-3-phosphate transport system permease component